MKHTNVWPAEGGASHPVYPESVHTVGGAQVFMVDLGEHDALVTDSAELGFRGETVTVDGTAWIQAPLSHENAECLRNLFPFTAPQRVLERDKTFGVGDRLGIACPGHIRVFARYPQVTPVFAQQSIRELTLTNRTYEDVLDCVTFAVFRENYTGGYGADGDHLKTAEEVQYALRCGYTMITLDCSEQIDDGVNDLSDAAVAQRYQPDPELEARYLGRAFDVGEGVTLRFDEPLFRRTVLIYGKAIDHAADIFHSRIAVPGGQAADFELSIDETSTPTLPIQHYFVANELIRRGVRCATVAPRFCGEFQKGIDYIGDTAQFQAELKEHAAIARHFGYKLSVHSGSDKFSIFPAVGVETRGRFHLKTAGTSWLEAMLLIAEKEPGLYREIHRFALGAFDEARKYYHVTTDLSRIPDPDTLRDDQLPELFRQNDARQLLHITYGFILGAKDEAGNPRFRDRLYHTWRVYAAEYGELLYRHIGNHVKKILCEG